MTSRSLHITGAVLRGSAPATALAIDDDGQHVAIARLGEPGTPKVLVFRGDGTLVDQWGHDAIVGRGVCFGPGAGGAPAIYAALGTHRQISLIRRSVSGGAEDQLASYGGSSSVYSLARSADGTKLAVCGSFVEIWDTKRGTAIARTPPRAPSTRLQVAFTPDAASILVHGHVEDQLVELSLPELAETRRWPAPGPRGRQIAVSPDGGYLLSVSEAHTGAFLYRLPDNQRALPDFFDETKTVGQYAFVSSSLLLRVVGAQTAAFDLQQSTFVPGPALGGDREVGITVARNAPQLALAWADSDAITGSFRVDD